VKGEVCGCDLVGLRAEAEDVDDHGPPLVVIGEMKQSFTLELVLQGVDRMAAGDEIWLAVRASVKRGRERDARVRKLCRLLGFGLLGVLSAGRVEILVEPGPWQPRRNARRRSRLVAEHRRRRGDPAMGGGTRAPIMTAYRQQALIIAAALDAAARQGGGAQRPRDIKLLAPDAPKILLHNVYGWFLRIERGRYGLTDAGRAALLRWPQAA
jgi:hypothetical protein